MAQKKSSKQKIKYLNQYKHAQYELEYIEQQLDRVRTKYIGRAIEYSDMPKAFNSEHDLSDYAAEVEPLLNRYATRRHNAIVAMQRVERAISKLEDNNERYVLELRYINCLSWREVADTIGYTERRVYQIHGVALLNLRI